MPHRILGDIENPHHDLCAEVALAQHGYLPLTGAERSGDPDGVNEPNLLEAGDKSTRYWDNPHVLEHRIDTQEQTMEFQTDYGLFTVPDYEGSNICLLENPETGERYKFYDCNNNDGGGLGDYLVSMKTGEFFTLDEVPPFNVDEFRAMYKEREEKLREAYYSLPEFFEYYFDSDVLQQVVQNRSEAYETAVSLGGRMRHMNHKKHQKFFGHLRIG